MLLLSSNNKLWISVFNSKGWKNFPVLILFNNAEGNPQKPKSSAISVVSLVRKSVANGPESFGLVKSWLKGWHAKTTTWSQYVSMIFSIIRVPLGRDFL